MAYKFEYFIGILNGLLFIYIFTSLWSSIYANSTTGDNLPFNRAQMISYAVYAMLFRISMTMDDNEIGRKVRTGDITMDLIKPVNFALMTFGDALGRTIFHWLTRVIPILVVTLFAFSTPLPTDPANYALAMIAWIFGYLIAFMIDFMVGMLAFWFMEAFAFQLMKFGFFTLFAGGIVPIDFFPEVMKPFIALLPFQYILYTPTVLFIGHVRGIDALKMIGAQMIWVFLLLVLARFMWKKATEKLIVQGG